MIIISPYSKTMRNGKPHPKNYPYWEQTIELLGKRLPFQAIIQVGVYGEEQLVRDMRSSLKLTELAELIKECDTWISVDNFFQHFAWDLGKRGVAIFAQSDPLIFGHPENINLLKDRRYLREKQFWQWEQAEFVEAAFVTPAEVVAAVTTVIPSPLVQVS